MLLLGATDVSIMPAHLQAVVLSSKDVDAMATLLSLLFPCFPLITFFYSDEQREPAVL